MPLTPNERAARARLRMIETAKKYQTSTYSRTIVSRIFQKMIRAEWGARIEPHEWAIVDGEMTKIPRAIGQCVCVTCGKVERWDAGLGGMHTGHFIASRRNSILFEELNVAPQCSRCNVYMSGNPQPFRQWMLAIHGEGTVERLERLKTQSRQFMIDELVDMRIEFGDRLKAAEEKMRRG